MLNYQKCLLLSLLMLFFVAHANAADTSIVIYAKDGTRSVYSLNEHPKVFFDSDHVLLKTDDTQIMYPISQMLKIVFEDPTSLNDLSKSQIGYTLRDNQIIIEGLSVGNKVMIYNTAGLLCASFIAGSDGCLDISLDSLPTNIYIVKAGDTTIKFQKK